MNVCVSQNVCTWIFFNRLDKQALGTGREEKQGFCQTRLANEWLIICSSVDSSVGLFEIQRGCFFGQSFDEDLHLLSN